MLLVKKCHFFLHLDLVKIRLQIMLNYFKEKKRNLFWPYKNEFFKLLKNALFHPWPKNAIFFLYIDLIKIRLEIILSDFAEKKQNVFGLKKQNFWKSKKSHFFKGLTHAFNQKCQVFSLSTIDQNKTRSNA